ncbi:MAG: hypothetical protein COC05_05360 [Gammaproteobacteria bacterium]|nr:MAG: hypothetical protein COC05_05360 [Gammaproteobacteria bacterium]
MVEIQLATLVVSIQAVEKQIEYFEGLLTSETVKDKANIQELLLTFDQASENLKEIYMSRWSEGSNFPKYELLVRDLS